MVRCGSFRCSVYLVVCDNFAACDEHFQDMDHSDAFLCLSIPGFFQGQSRSNGMCFSKELF